MNLDFETYDSLKSFIESDSYIYIIYSEYGCKIGYTKSPLERIEQIKQGLPSQKCFFVGLYQNEKALIYEKRLHRIFKAQRIGGEWFILDDEDIDYIDSYLLSNGFKCFIKKSIIWANYIVPSIYINGNVKVVNKISHRKIKTTLQTPGIFLELIRKPEYGEIEKNIAKFMTPKEISERLNVHGYRFNAVMVGKILTALKFERATNRDNIKGYSVKGYYVVMKK